MVIDQIQQLIQDFRAKHHHYPEVLVLNRDYLIEIEKSADFFFVVEFDRETHFPKRINGLLYDVCDVSEMSVR